MVTKWLQFGNKKLQSGNIVKHAPLAVRHDRQWCVYVYLCIFLYFYAFIHFEYSCMNYTYLFIHEYSLFMNKKRVVKLYRLTT